MNQFMHVPPDMIFDGPVLFLIVALVCALALAVQS
jgi:hypothetical protein